MPMIRMRRKSYFPGQDQSLQLALREIEDNAAAAIDALSSGRRACWGIVETSGSYLAQPWDMVVVSEDTLVTLPESVAQNAGIEIAVAVQGTPTVSVAAVRSSMNHTPAANAVTVYRSTGKGWLASA
jgi:hypothetical protein